MALFQPIRVFLQFYIFSTCFRFLIDSDLLAFGPYKIIDFFSHGLVLPILNAREHQLTGLKLIEVLTHCALLKLLKGVLASRKTLEYCSQRKGLIWPRIRFCQLLFCSTFDDPVHLLLVQWVYFVADQSQDALIHVIQLFVLKKSGRLHGEYLQLFIQILLKYAIKEYHRWQTDAVKYILSRICLPKVVNLLFRESIYVFMKNSIEFGYNINQN